MSDTDMGLSDGLLRQRRNLLITSLLLIFLHQSEATIEALSVVGTSLKFNNPKAIYQGLWLLFIYFNLRYFQHYLDEGRSKLNNIWHAKFSKNAHEQTEIFVKQKVAESNPELKINGLPDSALQQTPWFKWKVAKEYIQWRNQHGHHQHLNRDISIPRLLLLKPIIKTYYQVILLGSAFTDYAIPFLLSAITFAACGFSEWNGSLHKVCCS